MQRTIASAYEALSASMVTEESASDTNGINKAIVWTFLDQARWTAEAAQWLRVRTPFVADQLIAIGATSSQPVDSLQTCIDSVEDGSLDVLTTAVERTSEMFDASLLEGLVALLFRLQLLYTLRARTYRSPEGLRTKFDYLKERGYPFVQGCQAIARALYVQDPRSAMQDYPRDAHADDWVVFPCGRFNEQSVWADQIVIELLTKS